MLPPSWQLTIPAFMRKTIRVTMIVTTIRIHKQINSKRRSQNERVCVCVNVCVNVCVCECVVCVCVCVCVCGVCVCVCGVCVCASLYICIHTYVCTVGSGMPDF